MEKRFTLFLLGLVLSIGTAFGQAKINGTVVSQEDGEAVVGASVMVQGTTTGTVTDIDGKFSLNVPAGKKLVVSYIGMTTQTLTARDGMKVVLANDNHQLTEVVVTGMTQQDKRLFSGAATKIDASKAKIDGMADVSRSLEGRAAGVSVQNVSGTFGTAPKIRVRGATSIYGSSKPLWVVDGVIMEDVTEVDADNLSSGDAATLISSAIAGLNADDIESFQILKDGSATSIYGARAMAGVIVVTTKKGKAGQSHLSYTGEYTLRLKPSYRNFNIMNSQDQMEVYRELEKKGYLNYAEIANASTSGVYGHMYQLLSEYDATKGQFGLENTQDARDNYLRAAEYRNTDWFDQLFSSSIMHNHSVSASGGTDKGQYYASLSAMYDPGWYKASRVQRYTGNLNTTYNISKQVGLNLIANASYRKQRAPGSLTRTVDPASGTVSRAFDINPYSYSLNTSRTLDPNVFYTRNYAPFNIFNELENNYMDLNVHDFRIQASVDYKPISKVKLTALVAVKSAASTMEHIVRENSNQALAYRAMGTTTIRDANPYLYTDPDNPFALPESVLPEGGILDRTGNHFFGWDSRFSASYNDVFNDTHIVNLYAGMETNSVDRKQTFDREWGMMFDAGEIAKLNYRAFKMFQEEGTDYYSLANTHIRSLAYFGTGTYSYKGRYQVTGTFRYEGTNYLGKATSARWLPTYNVSGAWNAHEEGWFADVFKKALTHATLRLSYSLTGDRPPVTNSLPIFTAVVPWRPFTTVQETGYDEQFGNKNLTYEKKREFNLGFDFGFLDNRINLTADFYWRRNKDLIGYVNHPNLGSYNLANVAAMKSNGVEVSLNTQNIRSKDFSWETNFIFSWTHNEITSLFTHARVIDLVQGTGYSLVGYPVNSIFSIPFAGLSSDGLPTFWDADGNRTTSGIYLQERDQDKIGFLKYEGPADPTTTGSFGNVFRYKNWDLNVFITYSFGNKVRLNPVFSNRYDDMDALPKEFRNRWAYSGNEATTDIPAIATRRQNRNDSQLNVAYNSYNYSDARIAKGDFIRMKEISLGYTFPASLISPIGINSLALKLQATNLFLFYADKKLNGQDPEFFNTGGVAAPVPKQFTLTLRLGL